MPFATIGFIIGGLVSMGMPGFSGFVAEFPIFMGVWQAQWLVAVIASISIVITAAYIMMNIRKVFFAELSGMGVYLLMAIVLIWRPEGLLGRKT